MFQRRFSKLQLQQHMAARHGPKYLAIQQPRRTAGSGKYFVQACSPKNPATKMTTTTTPMM